MFSKNRINFYSNTTALGQIQKSFENLSENRFNFNSNTTGARQFATRPLKFSAKSLQFLYQHHRYR